MEIKCLSKLGSSYIVTVNEVLKKMTMISRSKGEDGPIIELIKHTINFTLNELDHVHKHHACKAANFLEPGKMPPLYKLTVKRHKRP